VGGVLTWEARSDGARVGGVVVLLAVRRASRCGERGSIPRGLLGVGRRQHVSLRAAGEGGVRSAGADLEHPELKRPLKAPVAADAWRPGHAARSGVTSFGQGGYGNVAVMGPKEMFGPQASAGLAKEQGGPKEVKGTESSGLRFGEPPSNNAVQPSAGARHLEWSGKAEGCAPAAADGERWANELDSPSWPEVGR